MKTLTTLCLLALAVIWLPAARGADKPPKADSQGDIQDVVFLAEARPLLIRLHVRLDGKPVSAAWDDFIKYLFAYLDVNGDGFLDKDEVERVPSAAQVSSGGLARALGGRGRGRGRPVGGAGGPTLEALDADKDGKVTLAELAACYRKNGLAPFHVQTAAAQSNPLGGLALLGGGRATPTVEAVSKAAFSLLDTNKDGKLSKEELAAAPSVLLRLDEDEDEMVTAAEMVPNAGPSLGDLFAGRGGRGMMGMGGPNRGGTADKNSRLIPLTKPGEAPEILVAALQERYGARAKKRPEKKLDIKDLGLDAATFRRLDTDGDGLLDAKELAGFVRRAPDLELVVRLGGTEASVEAGAARKDDPLAGKVTRRDGMVLLDLGATRAELRGDDEEDRTDAFGGIIRQQLLAQFRQADKDNNGFLDRKEAEASRQFRGLFKAMDRDGDGKLTEKEVIAYLDQAREIQARARAASALLVLSDESRGLFDLLDTDRDGRLSVREMRGAVRLLKQLDRTGKGYLTRADIPRSYRLTLKRGMADTGPLGGAAAFLALYGGSDSGEQGRRLTKGPLWFRKMDRNRDGDVSRKEFLFSAELFKKIDTDGDGLISLEEAERYDAQLRQQK
jgi:Ca2+-binding EF-hand superfamily protein